MGTTDLLEKKKVSFISKIEIRTQKDLTALELGYFLIGLDKMYRLIVFTQLLHVESDYLESMRLIDKQVNSLVEKYLCGNSDLEIGILEILSIILPYGDKNSIRIQEANAVYESTRKKSFKLNDIKGSLIRNLSNSLKSLYLNRGLDFKAIAGVNLNTQQKILFKEILVEGVNKINFVSLFSLTSKNFTLLNINRINYNSPGSFDFLGLGKILEVLKDLILEVRKESRDKNKLKIQEQLLLAELDEKCEINKSLKLQNIEKYLQIRETARGLNDDTIDQVFSLLVDSKKSISLISEKITTVQLRDEES